MSTVDYCAYGYPYRKSSDIWTSLEGCAVFSLWNSGAQLAEFRSRAEVQRKRDAGEHVSQVQVDEIRERHRATEKSAVQKAREDREQQEVEAEHRAWQEKLDGLVKAVREGSDEDEEVDYEAD